MKMEVKKRRLDAAADNKEAGNTHTEQRAEPFPMTGIHSMEDFKKHFAEHRITLASDKATLTPVHWIGPECNRKLCEFLKLNAKQLCYGLLTAKVVGNDASAVPLVLDVIRMVALMNPNMKIACNLIPHAVSKRELYESAKILAASAGYERDAITGILPLPEELDATNPDDLVDVAQAFQHNLHEFGHGIGPQGRLQITVHDEKTSRLLAVVETRVGISEHQHAGYFETAAELAKAHLLHGATLPLWGVYTDHQNWQFLKMTKEADGRLMIHQSCPMSIRAIRTIDMPKLNTKAAHFVFGMLFEMLQIPVDVDVSAAHAALERRLTQTHAVLLADLDKDAIIITTELMLVIQDELIGLKDQLISGLDAKINVLKGTNPANATLSALDAHTLRAAISEKEAMLSKLRQQRNQFVERYNL